jgi:monoamine oxidase
MDVGIIEARGRTGGRILSIHQSGVTLEAGPEFIHGHLKETISLLKEYHIPFLKTAGKMYYARGGRFIQQQENGTEWDRLIKKMKEIKEDLPLMQFLLENFNGEKYRKLRESATRFAEGFDLADVNRVGVLSLIREWEQEESVQYRIPSGYGQLTDALTGEFISSGGEIFLDQPVSAVQWERDAVCVTLSNGRRLFSKKLVITLPAAVLTGRQGGNYSIRFSPEIPEKRAALDQIGFGTAVKIVLLWQVPFWKPLMDNVQFIFSEKNIPAWWTQNPVDSNVLVGWAGGPAAEGLSGLTENDLLNIALEDLSSMFEIPKDELKKKLTDARIFNWKKELFTGGAYSFTLAGSGGARTAWKSPLAETLYFAGEACYGGPHIGTVEAAIVSGMEAARELLMQTGTK